MKSTDHLPGRHVLGRRAALQLAMAAAAGTMLPATFASPRKKAAAAGPFEQIDGLAAALIGDGITPGVSLAVMRAGTLGNHN